MGHTQFDGQLSRQSLEVFFEQVVRGIVAAAAIAKDQQPFRMGICCVAVFMPPQGDAIAAELAGIMRRVEMNGGVVVGLIKDAVRDQFPLAGTAEIMVECFDCLPREGFARTIEIAQQFLFFRVDADHGIARGLVFISQFGNVFKLSVAVGMMPHRLFFSGGATPHFEFS